MANLGGGCFVEEKLTETEGGLDFSTLGNVIPGDWVNAGLCRQTDPDVFHPETGGMAIVAKTICGRCEVREQCLEYVDKLEAGLDTRQTHGIYAGLSRSERAKRRRDLGI